MDTDDRNSGPNWKPAVMKFGFLFLFLVFVVDLIWKLLNWEHFANLPTSAIVVGLLERLGMMALFFRAYWRARTKSQQAAVEPGKS